MLQWNPAEQECLLERMAYAAALRADNLELRICLTRLYGRFMEVPTAWAKTMADHLLLRIEEYDRSLQEIQRQLEDKPALRQRIKSQLDKQVEKLPLQEQCCKLHALFGGTWYTGSITEQAQQELLERAADRILNGTWASSLSPAEADDRALKAMVVYTMLLGEDGGLQTEAVASIDQIVLAVCSGSGTEADRLTAGLLLAVGALQGSDSAAIIQNSVAKYVENYGEIKSLTEEVVPLIDHLKKAEDVWAEDLEAVVGAETLQQTETVSALKEQEKLKETEELKE